MAVVAKLKYQRLSPQKARLVADIVRGKNALQALNILKFTNKKAALYIEKTLRSAIANAEHNNNMDPDKLFVSKILIDKGPKESAQEQWEELMLLENRQLISQ